MRTYRVASLGCKVNQYEGQLMAERLEAAGLAPAPDDQPADLAIANTCAVTALAAAKSLKLLRQLRRENPGAKLVAAGCLVTNAGAEALLRRSGADAAWPQAEKLDLPGVREKVSEKVSDTFSLPDFISRFDGHSRAFVKVQDGCSAGCAYCVVPLVRGRPHSRPLGEIGAEARKLDRAGWRELVVTGVHLGWYGRDLGGRPDLADVVGTVLAAAPRARVRLSSLDAAELPGRLLDLAAAEPRLCPHFHLPLQSGDDGVLRNMRRNYTAAEFLETVARVRERLDCPAISTDVIVGFPGESAAAFANTLKLCERAGFSRLHVFQFSPRKGTPAAEMPNRVDRAESRRRAGELKALGRELAARFAAACIGRVEEVLIEAGERSGYTARYVRTRFTAPEGQRLRRGEICRVKIARAEGANLFGSGCPA